MLSSRWAVTRGSFCRREPAAAFLGFLKGFSSKSSCLAQSLAKLSSDMYTSPRTSKKGTGSFKILGTEAMVRMFSVTSSPVTPSPRVEPRTNRPFSYSKATERPSNLGSTTYSTGPTASRTRRSKASSSSSEKESCRLSKGTWCTTGAKVLYTAPPTFWVGESAVTSSGNWASRSSSRR